MQELSEQVKEALKGAIESVHWLVLPGGKSDRFAFTIESDWSSKYAGYMLFASRNGEEKLLDMGSRRQKIVSSSYLGELDALVWACKRTKAFRESIPLVVRTANHALVAKWRSHNLYDSDVRIFRRWSWLVSNEQELMIEFMPGTENAGADLLSRPISGLRSEDTSGPISVVNQISIWDEIWEEHLKGDWGVFKTYRALKSKG